MFRENKVFFNVIFVSYSSFSCFRILSLQFFLSFLFGCFLFLPTFHLSLPLSFLIILFLSLLFIFFQFHFSSFFHSVFFPLIISCLSTLFTEACPCAPHPRHQPPSIPLSRCRPHPVRHSLQGVSGSFFGQALRHLRLWRLCGILQGEERLA